MNKDRIEKAAELLFGLLSEAYSSIDAITEVREVLNQILDGYIVITKEDAEALLNLVNTMVENDGNDPRLAGRDSLYLPLKKSLEGAIFG